MRKPQQGQASPRGKTSAPELTPVPVPARRVHSLGKSGARFLLQFATRDELASRWDAEVFTQAVRGPKAAEGYATDHFGLGDASREARVKWLAALLALPD